MVHTLIKCITEEVHNDTLSNSLLFPIHNLPISLGIADPA